ncbi:deoxyguanosinetriphosphate triphosphohydrolase family protein [Sphingomonas sp. KC8]|uniref:deoxyguanosinetriphosphate triphosphohydrolase family protein n=1 Tax=Sphingomonas sp. KC8 TaxID=1030157 RepID=UPI0018DFC7FA|nr:dNTP triphosphohydrolase [Sphingomonas sp. KC8]
MSTRTRHKAEEGELSDSCGGASLDAARVSRCYSDETALGQDQRRAFERDRDRILYSSAFHRLAGITQIVRAGELDIFHTRQQHTYKVAQIGRRLAEHRIREQEAEATLHGLDAEVVEAACLAHDLGHPPFGHAAETELDRIVRDPKVVGGNDEDAADDGYEGNAQTFRILTKLAVRYSKDNPGLDLTRATLAATLKYPWLRDLDHDKKKSKWSAYVSEERAFSWTREHCTGDFKTAEAELMDWADDIAYSVHDLEDFHRVGIIPWSEVVSREASDGIVQGALAAWKKDPGHPADATRRLSAALERVTRKLVLFPSVTKEAYNGAREQRRQLRNFTSQLIGNYVRAITLTKDRGGPTVSILPDAADEVRVLKHFARHYVIGLPALHAQQYGQKKIVRDLFKIFLDEGKCGNLKLFPARLRYIWEDNHEDKPARLAADCVASLTENEAYQLHGRFTGSESGLVLDPIVR